MSTNQNFFQFAGGPLNPNRMPSMMPTTGTNHFPQNWQMPMSHQMTANNTTNNNNANFFNNNHNKRNSLCVDAATNPNPMSLFNTPSQNNMANMAYCMQHGGAFTNYPNTNFAASSYNSPSSHFNQFSSSTMPAYNLDMRYFNSPAYSAFNGCQTNMNNTLVPTTVAAATIGGTIPQPPTALLAKQAPAPAPAYIKASRKQCPEYNMNHPERGYALIININKFKQNSHPERLGSKIDVENLKKTLGNLGFRVDYNRNDWTAKEIRDRFSYYSKVVDHSQFDCFFCVLMSHGDEGQLD